MDFAFNHGSQLIGSACNNLLHKLLQMQRSWERATFLCSSDAPAQAGLHIGDLHHDSGAWHRRLTTTPLFGLRLLMHAVDWIAVTQSPWWMVFMASSVFQFQFLCSLSLDRANWNNWLSIALLRTHQHHILQTCLHSPCEPLAFHHGAFDNAFLAQGRSRCLIQ